MAADTTMSISGDTVKRIERTVEQLPGGPQALRKTFPQCQTTEEELDRAAAASARAHAVTLLAADRERVQRLERDLDQARRDVEASRRLAAQCGAVEASR